MNFNKGRRHTCANIRIAELQYEEDCFITPAASKTRRRSVFPYTDLVKAPVKEKICRRFSSPEMLSKDRFSIRKKLNFDALDGSTKKRSMNPLLVALHSNDLAVPFSELEVGNGRSAKRVKFDDEVITSPVPETPVFNPTVRTLKSDLKTPICTDSFTKLTDPFGRKLDVKRLFNIGTTPNKDDKTQARPSARNLTLMW